MNDKSEYKSTNNQESNGKDTDLPDAKFHGNKGEPSPEQLTEDVREKTKQKPGSLTKPRSTEEKISAITAKFTMSQHADWFARCLLLLIATAFTLAMITAWIFIWPEWQTRENTIINTHAELQTVLDELEILRNEIQSNTVKATEQQLPAPEKHLATKLQEQLNISATATDQVNNDIKALRKQFNQLDTHLARLTATDQRTWLINEAEFLVRLAAQRLLVSRDIDTAKILIDNADNLLAEVNDPRLELARLAIGKDRASLAALPRIDSVGLYVRLSTLIDQVMALNILAETKSPLHQSTTEPIPPNHTEAGWQAALIKLSDHLVIRRRDNEKTRRLLAPEWSLLAQKNLHILLEQAKIAALSNNQILYDAALKQALALVNAFDEANPNRSTAIRNELAALATIDVMPALPNLAASRAALANAIRQINGISDVLPLSVLHKTVVEPATSSTPE